MTFAIDGPNWVEEAAKNYVEGGWNGIRLRVASGRRIADLSGLHVLPGLRYLEVAGAVSDDTAAFHLKSLRELVLLTECRAGIPLMTTGDLTSLGIDDRPGKEKLTTLSNLNSLHIWSWKDADFQFMEGLHGLTEVHIEGNGQAVSPRGIEGCPSLVEVKLVSLRVDELKPFSGLSNLRRLWVIGEPKVTGDIVLDLDDIAGLSRLTELKLTFAGSVQSVHPLVSMVELRDVRLRGTRIVDGDEAPLVALARKAIVVRPGE